MRARTKDEMLTAAAAAICLCGILAAPAVAGTGTTAKGVAPLTTPGAATATANCPQGTRSTGGGFKVANGFEPPPVSAGLRSITQVSAPTGKRAWRVVTPGFGSATSTTLTAFARCSAGIGSVTVATESANLDPTVATRLQPRCPPTRRLLGGGYRVAPTFHFTPAPTGGPLIVALESRKIGGRDWRVTVANVNLGNSVTGKVTAYALCGSGGARSKTVARSAALDYGTRAGAVARCPTKWHTVSGGFKASPLFEALATSDFVLPLFDVSAPQGTRDWSVGASSYTPFTGSVADGKITVYAYCEHN